MTSGNPERRCRWVSAWAKPSERKGNSRSSRSASSGDTRPALTLFEKTAKGLGIHAAHLNKEGSDGLHAGGMVCPDAARAGAAGRGISNFTRTGVDLLWPGC